VLLDYVEIAVGEVDPSPSSMMIQLFASFTIVGRLP
jgi:hypothetical protein